jgi:spore maturation protein CgeB
MALFEEDLQAAYFGDDPELLAACRRWLADDHGRQNIAEAGYQKAISGGHSHHDLLRTAFRLATTDPP